MLKDEGERTTICKNEQIIRIDQLIHAWISDWFMIDTFVILVSCSNIINGGLYHTRVGFYQGLHVSRIGSHFQ